MKKKTLSYCIEPFLHISVITTTLFFTVPHLFKENYNAAEAWCGLASLPASCSGNGDCERGSPIVGQGLGQYLSVVLGLLGSAFFLIVTSLSLVCYTVCHDRFIINQHETGDNMDDQDGSGCQNSQQSENYRRMRSEQHKAANNFVFLQAFAYVGAFLLTITFPILILASDYIMFGADFEMHREIMKKLQLIFQPLQGFFNFCIFFSSKLFQQWNTDRNGSIFSAIRKVFGKNYDDPFVISRLSVVRHFHEEREVIDLAYSSWGEDDEEEVIEDPIVEDGISYPSTNKTPTHAKYTTSSVNISMLSEHANSIDIPCCGEKEHEGHSVMMMMGSFQQQDNDVHSSSSSVLSPLSWFSRDRTEYNSPKKSNGSSDKANDVETKKYNNTYSATSILRKGGGWLNKPPVDTKQDKIGKKF